MSDDWDVEILTTCARDARTWADSYEAGAGDIDGVPARRFSVPEPRDGKAFDRLSRRVIAGGSTGTEQETWMRAQGPYSPQLFDHLAREGRAYDVVFFYSTYATTYFGLPAVADRAVLVPLAHDEWTLALPLLENTFAAARAIAFVSEEERALVARRFPGAEL
ncbi:MAG: glycosyltransferase family 1 protein, partial [Candidatus Eremiobacteraeota bacterium]|nr:glycosyltransferase family 1 protein [Candidatus Eremiobacteraeota bacterium]